MGFLQEVSWPDDDLRVCHVRGISSYLCPIRSQPAFQDFYDAMTPECENRELLRLKQDAQNDGSAVDSPTVPEQDVSGQSLQSKLQRRFDKAWEKMLDLREDVVQARLVLRESTLKLKEPRAQVQALHNQLWTAWQNHWDRNTIPDRVELTGLYEKMQRLLDEVGPHEAAVKEQEDGLHVLEYRLNDAERDVYSRAILRDHNRTSDVSVSPSDEVSERSWAHTVHHLGERDATQDEALQGFLDRVGDAKIAQERVLQLQQERDQYTDIAQHRAALNIPQYQPNAQFLEDFEAEYELRKQELEAINQDLSTLAIAAGIDGASRVGQDTLMNVVNESRGLMARATWPRASSPSNEVPLRRSFSYSDLHDLRQKDRLSFRERINTWMREVFKASKWVRMHQYLTSNDPGLPYEEWWRRVKQYWKQESSGSHHLPSRPVSSASQTRASQRSSGDGSKASSPVQQKSKPLPSRDKAAVDVGVSIPDFAFVSSTRKRLHSTSAIRFKPRAIQEDSDWEVLSDFETSRSQ